MTMPAAVAVTSKTYKASVELPYQHSFAAVEMRNVTNLSLIQTDTTCTVAVKTNYANRCGQNDRQLLLILTKFFCRAFSSSSYCVRSLSSDVSWLTLWVFMRVSAVSSSFASLIRVWTTHVKTIQQFHRRYRVVQKVSPYIFRVSSGKCDEQSDSVLKATDLHPVTWAWVQLPLMNWKMTDPLAGLEYDKTVGARKACPVVFPAVLLCPFWSCIFRRPHLLLPHLLLPVRLIDWKHTSLKWSVKN